MCNAIFNSKIFKMIFKKKNKIKKCEMCGQLTKNKIYCSTCIKKLLGKENKKEEKPC
jgi:recombinational DNA repair protein RecR